MDIVVLFSLISRTLQVSFECPMRIFHALFLTSIALLVMGCADTSPLSCSETWHIDGQKAFTREMKLFDRSASFVIESLAPGNHPELIALDDFTVNGEPVMWLSPDYSNAFVNSSFFTDLQRVDLTSLSGEIAVGKATPLLMESWTPREVIVFLLESEVLMSFLHLDADVCISDEGQDDHSLVFELRGTHRFCTNECQELSYALLLRIDEDGMIGVEPKTI